MILLFLSLPAFSQNTKGDRAETGGKGAKRENRFRMPFKKKDKRKASYRRAQSRGASKAGSARRSLKSPKPKIYPQSKRYVNNSSTKPDSKTRTGRKVPGTRVPVRSQTAKSRNVYPQYGRYNSNVSRKPKSTQRVTPPSGPNAHNIGRKSKKVQRVYPQSGRYVNNPSRKPKNVSHSVSNKSTLARLNRLQGGPDNGPPGKKRKVVPRSASRSFMARRSINIYASFPRPKKKGEQATTKDLAGRRLRMRNYQTPHPKKTIAPTFRPYYGRKRIGDRPYKGPAAGKYRSATQTKPQAWTGDIAGRKIRGRNYSSKPKAEAGQSIFPRRKSRARYGDKPYRGPGGGYRSASQPGEKRTGINPVPARTPGIGANRIGKFQGNIKRGRGFNDQGEEYTGTVKRGRPLKGGGSVSGRLWNNRQTPVPVRTPRGDAAKAGGFPGKLRRFQNDRGFNDQGEEYTGVIKRRRPLKGGGSVSGKLWNNQEAPIPARGPSQSTAKAGAYTGTIKARRPLKGGGSVSGKLWNNDEAPIPVRTPPESARKVSGFPGKMRRFSHTPGFNDQGEEFTGYVKLPKFRKNYIKNPNASEDAIKKKKPTNDTYKVDGLQIPVKQRRYVKNKNASENALPKQKPTETTYHVGELQVKVKQPAYGKKPKAAEGAMPGIKPTKSSVKASEFSRSIKRTWDYVHNPSSAKEALKVKEPGKAFAKSTDYQGNIKMKKFALFEKNRGLHPDAKFVKLNKNNVDSERDLLTNFKLWWARLFKKEETQPEHLKEKGRKPRYDDGEDGLWYK